MGGRTKSVPSLAIQDSKGLSNTAHTSLPIFLFVLRLRCLFTVSLAGFRAGNYRDRLSWDLACSPRAFNPLSACPRFTSNNLVATLIVTLWYDPEFTGRLGVKLACGWQILSLLKCANARPGSEPDDTIDLPSVMSLIAQSFLHLLDTGPMPDRRYFFAKVGCRGERRRAWSGDSRHQQYEDDPSPRSFAGYEHTCFAICYTLNRFAHLLWQYCAEWLMSWASDAISLVKLCFA
jgi:hypothetical protein